jgi:hypothetical protein
MGRESPETQSLAMYTVGFSGTYPEGVELKRPNVDLYILALNNNGGSLELATKFLLLKIDMK